MFVLPEVYEAVVPNEDIKRIQANTYAALRELDFLMHSPRRSFQVTGKNDTLVDYARDIPPFDFSFLFGNKNRRGAILSERQSDSGKPSAPDDRVAQCISEAVVTDVLSSVTDKCESAYSNMLRPGDPVKLADNSRKFHRSFSAVGVSSTKLLPIEHYRQLLIAKLTDQVIDFLLRPDPEVTERVLAERFLNDNFSGLAERFALSQSLNEDPDYKEFDTNAFAERFDDSETRAHAWDIFRQWSASVASEAIDLNNPLTIESEAVNLWRVTGERVVNHWSNRSEVSAVIRQRVSLLCANGLTN